MVTLSGRLSRLVPLIALHNKPFKSVDTSHGYTMRVKLVS
jgi:hypothetical protein